MNIGLIFPNRDRKDCTVHIGLGYIASYARNMHSGLNFIILDTRVATAGETREFFRKNLDLIGITVLSPVYHEVIEVFKHLRTTKPETPICLGGPYVTTIMQEIFEETPVDFAVYGEGEITFSELIGYLKGTTSLESIKGLMYRKNGKIFTNEPREQIEDLDLLPIPAYDLFKMNRYPMHRITTSRGCPYKCVFCNSSSIWLGKWRKRSPEKIMDEIHFLIENHKKKVFFFNDNSFNIDLKRIELFCTLLLENNFKILWSTPVRPELITDDIAHLMKKSGCYNVSVGIESANNEILKKMKKKNTIEKMNNGIKIFKKAGIEVLGQFVIGSPGDTLETVRESIRFAKKSDLDYVMFYSILPFKTTEQWDYVINEGNLYNEKIHEYHSVKPRIVFETPEFPYNDRLEAINLAKKEGYYSETNDRNRFFDFGKNTAKKIIQILPDSSSEKIYLFMKNFYRKNLRK